MLSRMIRTCATALGVLVCAVSAEFAAAHGVTIKVQHALPADSPFHTAFLIPWTEKVAKDSGGRLHFQLSPGTQGTDSQLFDRAKSGEAEMVWASTDIVPARFTSLEVFALPFMTNSTQGSSRALWEYVRMSDLAQTEFDEMRVLAVHQSDAPQFHTRERSIKSITDLRGMKLGVPSHMGAQVLAALGANAVEIPAAQTNEALAKGTIDGALLPWEAVSTLKLDAALKSHSEADPAQARLYAPVYVLAMNAGAYKALPDDLKKVIQANSGAETSAWLAKVFDDAAAAARKRAADRGDPIHVIARDELARWKESVQTMIDAWIKQVDQRGEAGKKLVESAREAIAEYDTRR